MGKAIRASLLVLLLCSVARAGHIPDFSPTPPPAQSANGYIPTFTPAPPVSSVERAGHIPNFSPDTLTQTVLDLLAVLPALL